MKLQEMPEDFWFQILILLWDYTAAELPEDFYMEVFLEKMQGHFYSNLCTAL